MFDYYFPLCRFWEMAIGGLLTVLNPNIQNKFLKNIISLIGFASILYCAF